MSCAAIEGHCEPMLKSAREVCNDAGCEVSETSRSPLDRLADLSLMLFRYRFVRAELFERAMRELGPRNSSGNSSGNLSGNLSGKSSGETSVDRPGESLGESE